MDVLAPGVDGRAVALVLLRMVLVELAGLIGEEVNKSLRLTALEDMLLVIFEEILAASELVTAEVFGFSSLTALLDGE